MKEFLKILALVGALALVLVVRAYAAPDPVQAFQAATGTQQVVTLTPIPQNSQPVAATPSSPGDPNTYSWGNWMGRGMMGGMKMGSSMMGRMGWGGMHGDYSNDDLQVMMTGESHIHDDIAMQLGMTTQDLYNHMVAGNSLVQIAAEKGINEQQLREAIMSGRRLAYENAIRNGYMTLSQADSMLQNVNDSMEAMITGQGIGSSGWSMMWDAQPGE